MSPIVEDLKNEAALDVDVDVEGPAPPEVEVVLTVTPEPLERVERTAPLADHACSRMPSASLFRNASAASAGISGPAADAGADAVDAISCCELLWMSSESELVASLMRS